MSPVFFGSDQTKFAFLTEGLTIQVNQPFIDSFLKGCVPNGAGWWLFGQWNIEVL